MIQFEEKTVNILIFRRCQIHELGYAERSIKREHFMRSDALRAFRKWEEKEDKVEY